MTGYAITYSYTCAMAITNIADLHEREKVAIDKWSENFKSIQLQDNNKTILLISGKIYIKSLVEVWSPVVGI